MSDQGEPLLRLRTAQLERNARRLGLNTPSAIARHLKMNRTTMIKLLNGEMRPGERIIARTLTGFPDLRFEDLFEVTDPGPAEKAS